jgi:glycerol-3-phosphate acyltransferase PlsY
MNSWLIVFPGFLLAYLLGSIPTAVWVGKWFYGKDIRNEGSGNAGATNTIRVLGIKAGIPVILVDVFKGYLAVFLMRYFLPEGVEADIRIYLEIIAGFMAIIGHTLPVFAGFRGGKGVGTLLGVGIALYPVAVWVPVAVFVLVFLGTGYVSLGSILGTLVFPFVVFFFLHETNPGLIALSVAAPLLIMWTHRKNIKRLLAGKENRFRFRRKKQKPE